MASGPMMQMHIVFSDQSALFLSRNTYTREHLFDIFDKKFYALAAFYEELPLV